MTGTTKPDELRILAMAAGGITRSHLYRAISEEAYLKAWSSRTPSSRGLEPIEACGADAEQRMLQWVQVAISSVSSWFDEYMKQLFKQNHLVSTPPRTMLDLIRAAMVVVSSIYSSSTRTTNSEVPAFVVLVRSSYTPPVDVPCPITNASNPSSDARPNYS